MQKKDTSHIVKGLIIAVIIIIYSVIIYLTGQTMNKALSYIPYLVLIIGLTISGILFSREKNGNVTFGNVFAHCFRTNAVVAILVIIWSVLSLKLVFPDMQTQMLDYTQKEMEKNGQITDEQLSKAMGIMKKSLVPLMIGGAVLGYAVLGAIGSLLGATFAKKNAEIEQPFKQA